jgi:lactam utilization protein B
MKITDMTRLKQRNDETIVAFVQRFREVRNKCYSLNLGDEQLTELAFQGLLPTLREKYASHDFKSLSQLVSRMSQETAKSYKPRRNFQKKVSYVDYSVSEDEDNMIGLAEWVKGKKTISRPFGKKEPEKFGFDITKADKIFDLLLQQGKIKLSQFHTIPSAEELKRMKYLKWHNAMSHDTNDCKIFRQQIQSAIEKGGLSLKPLPKLKSR